MNDTIPYIVLAFSVIMGGMACVSLVKSPEERWRRQGFIYKYGSFLFYAILAIIGIFILVILYQRGSLTSFALTTASGGGFGVLFGGGAAAAARVAGPLAAYEARSLGVLPPIEQKPRRQVGHGRYNT